MNRTLWMRLAGVSGFLAVALGAFGAHGLKDLLTRHDTLAVWETAAQYHLIHSVAMLVSLALGANRWRPWLWFLAGNLAFSGSLYFLAALNVKWFGPITPIGGLCYLVGWLALARNAPRQVPAANGHSGD